MSAGLPQPRPALVRAPDGTVRPAAAHLSSLAVSEPAVAKSAKKHRKKGHSADDDTEVLVHLSKRDRKRLRRKAETYGWTAEEAAAHVLRAWSDS